MAAAKFSHQPFGAFLLFLVLQPFVVKAIPVKLESLRNLGRAQKGDTVNGLNQVKQYLKAFGYYPHHHDNNIFDDRFDDSLESALKAYQENFYLRATGKIDCDTIKTMMTPRCGVPDIIRNRTSNGSTKGTIHHGLAHGIFKLVANYSLFPGEPKWTKYNLTYNFLSGVQVISVQQLSPIIARAFQKWAAVSRFRFQQVAQGTRADIRIGFYRLDHGDGIPFEGPGGPAAHAFAPPDGRFHYDADENWSANPTSPNQLDLEAFAIHEIGHNLGLDHSQDQNAIMWPYIPNGKRNLGQDDINVVRLSNIEAVLQAELLVVWHGVCLAADYSFLSVLVESECAVVVSEVLKGESCLSEWSCIIKDIVDGFSGLESLHGAAC
ncbi:hypothetical protein PTKIN_Ptkin08bG0043400 [Pterospermum kingtungense]